MFPYYKLMMVTSWYFLNIYMHIIFCLFIVYLYMYSISLFLFIHQQNIIFQVLICFSAFSYTNIISCNFSLFWQCDDSCLYLDWSFHISSRAGDKYRRHQSLAGNQLLVGSRLAGCEPPAIIALGRLPPADQAT